MEVVGMVLLGRDGIPLVQLLSLFFFLSFFFSFLLFPSFFMSFSFLLFIFSSLLLLLLLFLFLYIINFTEEEDNFRRLFIKQGYGGVLAI